MPYHKITPSRRPYVRLDSAVGTLSMNVEPEGDHDVMITVIAGNRGLFSFRELQAALDEISEELEEDYG